MAQITYQNKADINTTATPTQNKVSADDVNEIKSVVNQNTPPGVVNIYAGTTAPTGWLICDGSAVSRTTYSTLFGVIGTAFGSGDGSTTFNLPNFKGRVPVGVDSNDADFDNIGETGGEKTHTLNVNEMPSHKHQLNKASTPGGNGSGLAWSGTTVTNGDGIYETGGSQPHNNLQPYLTMNYIISY